jgi:hypothetical protein
MLLAATRAAKKLFRKTISAAVFRNGGDIFCASGALISRKFVAPLMA